MSNYWGESAGPGTRGPRATIGKIFDVKGILGDWGKKANKDFMGAIGKYFPTDAIKKIMPPSGLANLKGMLGGMGAVLKKKAPIKAMKGAMKAMGGFLTSVGPTILLTILEKMRILEPILGVFSTLLGLLGGQMMMMLMPLFQRFMDVIMDPAFMDLMSILAELLVAILLPALTSIVVAMEIFLPLLPVITSAIREALPYISMAIQLWNLLVNPLAQANFLVKLIIGSLYGHSPGLIPALSFVEFLVKAVTFSLFIFAEILNILAKHAKLALEGIRIFVEGGLKTFMRIMTILGSQAKIAADNVCKLVGCVTGLINAARNFPGVGGGGRGGRGGGGGGIVSRAVSSARKVLGLHEGTPYVPSTGWWYLKEGEGVTPEGGSGGGITLNVQGLMKKDLVDYMVDELNKRKSLGMF